MKKKEERNRKEGKFEKEKKKEIENTRDSSEEGREFEAA